MKRYVLCGQDGGKKRGLKKGLPSVLQGKVVICVIVSCHPWAQRIVIFTHQPSSSSKMDHFFPSGIFPGLSDSFSFHRILKLLPRKQKMTSHRIHKAVLCPENNPGRSGFPVLQGQVKPHSWFSDVKVWPTEATYTTHTRKKTVYLGNY